MFEIFPRWIELWNGSATGTPEYLTGTLNLLMWLAPFLLTIIAMHFVLFKPMMRYLDERDAQSSNARKEASELSNAIDERLDILQKKMQAARAEVGQARSQARARAGAAAQVIIDAARSEAETKVADAVAQIRTDQVAASSVLQQTSSELSMDIAGQILGRAIEA